MRQIFVFLLLIIGLSSIQAQSPTRIKLTQLEQAKTVESSKAGQIGLTNSAGDQRYAQYVEVDLVQIGFVPTYTGNTSNYSEFVVASDSTRWYIDWQGRGFPLTGGGSGPDKNGYYGGNLGNGGDGTVPSVTKSTLTNQLTFYRAIDDIGGLVPIRIQVDAGNESDFQSFRQGADSLLIKRSDQDFYIVSTKNLGLQSADIVALLGDSIQMSNVPTAYPQERTFLTYSQNSTVTKKEGIDSTDLNFDAIQNLTATGSGPTSYDITLSNGGAVTLQEGPNIDLTRSGNSITITATGGGGGSQTFDNTSNATTHTLTLSNSGGSLQYIEGTGINFTSANGLNGTLTITNTSPDQVVTITNGGGLVVSGSYPNFTITANDPSATNEIQTISASGAGPTTYNIDLSLSGGSVTLQEGANIDLTRTGNTITIAAASGTQAFDNTSNATTHTLTLSNSGGSLQYIEGTGINFTSANGLNGTLTITNTSPDQVVTITNGGGLVVSGSYPNFTISANDPSATNEIQTISASGAGPTTYNIDLSLSGGSVTLQEGANIDLARSGNTITIAAASGLQTFDNTSNATTHTLTLSNSGGSLQYIEGTGINFTSANGLNGTLTITNTSPDQVVTITNGGGLVVSGSYPNFTISANDPSATNEIQTISASGVGPTAYNIDLSLSGGSVTLQEGANIDLTRSGNTITIAAASGLQTFSNTSTGTTHTLTLSNSGGSLQLVEGTGIQLATGGTTLDGIVTVTADDPSATNEGVLSVITGSPTTSIINSNSGGSSQVVLEAGTGISLTELANTITISATGASDGNGYYGGNGGNGGDGTIPSSTTSTITNQMTFYKPGVTDFDDLTPLRLVVDSGNESPFMAFRQGTDSMLVKRSDTEFSFQSPRGIFIQSGENVGLIASGIVTIQGDSILIQNVPDAYASEKTYLMMSQNGAITKRELNNTITTEYTTPGTSTVTVPAGAKSVQIYCVGAGGGGGGGRRGAAGVIRAGGGGGSAGAIAFGMFSLAELGSPADISVTVGGGGSGGAGRSTDDTSGGNGSDGGNSEISVGSSVFLRAFGGLGGNGGTATSGTAGAARTGDISSLAGANGGASGNAGTVSNSLNKCGGSGGGGGGISAANARNFSSGGGSGCYTLSGGGVGGGAGVAGNPGTAPTAGRLTGGGGGGGGSQDAAGSGGAGGNGARGAGGGGGGAGVNAVSSSGAGGNGGDGYILITWYF